MTSANKSSAGPTRSRINTRRTWMVAAMFSNGGVRTELTRHALPFFSFFFFFASSLETQIVGEGRMRRDINDSLCRNLADQTRPSSSSRAVSSVICLKLQSDLIPVRGSREGIDLLSCSLFEHFFFFFWNNWKKIRPIWKIMRSNFSRLSL